MAQKKLSSPTPHAEMHRFNVNIPEAIFQQLEDTARSRGQTISDVIRDAIELEQYIDMMHQDSSDQVVITGNSGNRPIPWRGLLHKLYQLRAKKQMPG